MIYSNGKSGIPAIDGRRHVAGYTDGQMVYSIIQSVTTMSLPVDMKPRTSKPLLTYEIEGNIEQAWTPSPEPEYTDNLLDNSKIELGSGTSSLVTTGDSIKFAALSANTFVNSAPITATDTTYSVSYETNTSISVSLKCYSTDDTFLGNANVLSTGTTGTRSYTVFTTLSNTAYTRLVFTSTVQGNVTISKPMFNAGGQVKDFVEYGAIPGTGPCEVKMVGDRTGNLFFNSIGHANISAGGVVSIGTESIMAYKLNIAKIQRNTEYTFSSSRAEVHVLGFFKGEIRAGTRTYDQTRIVTTGEKVYTFTSPDADVEYVAIRTAVENNDTMLTPGSTPLPYEPYGYKIPVVTRGRNLCPPLKSGVYLNFNDGKESTDSRTSTSDYFSVNLPLKTSRIAISGFDQTVANCVFAYDSGFNFIGRSGTNTGGTRYMSRDNFVNGNGSKEIEKIKYLRVFENTNPPPNGIMCTCYDASSDIPPFYPPFEPYTKITTNLYLPTPLAKNEVLKSDGSREGKWETLRLTPDLKFSAITTGTGSFTLSNTRIKPASANIAVGEIYSNYMDRDSIENIYKSTIAKVGVDKTGVLWISNTYWDHDLRKFYDWLDTNECYIYYQLATPTTEQIPDLPDIPTLKPTTVIDVDTEVKPASFSATFK